MNDTNLLYKLALSFIPNIGAIGAKTLISYCGGIKEVFEAKKSDLLKIPGIGVKKVNDVISNDALFLAEKELNLIQKAQVSIAFYLDDNYPARLRNYPDCPLLLYLKGQFFDPTKKTVAIIGTRQPSHYGIGVCERITESLNEFDVTILSGLAYGIDTIAHRKSVECQMRTYGILGNGIDKIYPSSNRSLVSKMLVDGGIISEFPFSTQPDRENFPKRNRIIAGMADAIVVIESKRKGGSIITAEIANDYNKDVFAVPGNWDAEKSEGCNWLIKTHKAHLISSVKDIAYIMGWEAGQVNQQMELGIGLNESEQNIVKIIKDHPEISFDSILYRSDQNLSRLSTMLLNLEFKGLIKSLPGKNYILA